MKRVIVALICLLAMISVQAQEREGRRAASTAPVTERSRISSSGRERSEGQPQRNGEGTARMQRSDQDQRPQGGPPAPMMRIPEPPDSAGIPRMQAERIASRLSLSNEQRENIEKFFSQRDANLMERKNARMNREQRAAAMESRDSAMRSILSVEQYEKFREIMRQQDIRPGGRMPR